MLVINSQEPKARIKMTHLSFEDFLEALCRLAVLKALPTTKEVEEAGCNAGTFLLRMQADEPADYDEFLAARAIAWGHLPDPHSEFYVPLDRRIDMLIELLIVSCQGGLSRAEGEKMALTEKQVRRKVTQHAE